MTNGPSNTALFSTAGASALISGTVVAGTIQFSQSGTITGSAVNNLSFGSSGATMTIQVDAGKTGTIGADITVFGNAATDQSNSLVKTGSGKLILSGTTRLATNTNVAKTSFFKVNGGGELEVTGSLIAHQQLGTNRDTATSFLGSTDGGNTLRVSGAGRLWTNDLTFGSAASNVTGTNNGNSLILSAAGTALDPTWTIYGSFAQLNMNSSNNNLTVGSGAYAALSTAGGTGTWMIGQFAGNNGNALLVDGGTLIRNVADAVNVGHGGSSNSYTIQNGGTVTGGRVGIGTNGGANNYQLVTGAGSAFKYNGASTVNSNFDIGATNGSTGNSLRIEAGGAVTFGGVFRSGTTVGVGEVVGANGNYISIIGGSTMNFVQTSLPLTVGGKATDSGVTAGGDGCRLDVFGGSTLNLDNSSGANASLPIGSSALFLTGTNTAFNLGDGTTLSTATIGSTTGTVFGKGVVFKYTGAGSSTLQLRINNGRLVAGTGIGATGTLVSGTGTVDLAGPAFISVPAAFTNVISAPITNSGGAAATLTKEGAGTLAIAAINTYSSTTFISAGTLQIGAGGTVGSLGLGNLVVNNATLAFNRTDTVVLQGGSGVISGPGAVVQAGAGTVILSGSNTYTGVTTAQAGVFQLGSAGALPGGILVAGGTSNLSFNGGVVGLSTATSSFTRTLNSAATVAAATFVGAGGWAALGVDATVNLGGAGATIVWGTANTGFNGQTLILGASAADKTVTLQNALDLGAAVRTVRVDNGSAAIDASLSGMISSSGAGGLNKTGAGALSLSAANTYTGVTSATAGILRLDHATALPGGVLAAGGTSNLSFNGGVIGLVTATSSYSRTLDSAATASATTFVGAGGWAAIGVDATVNLGGAGATVVWGTANTGFNGQTLILGASAADKTVTFQNALDLGTAVRTVQVDNGSATTDASLTGDISGSGAGGLNKTGAGTLKLSGNNTYTGATTISAGVLRLQTDTALPGGVSDVGGTSNLTFNGGVVGLEPSTELFFRSLGSVGDAAATTFVGAGGWAAYGVDAVVDLGGAGAIVSWGAANTGFNGKTLILGASAADKTVTLQNALDLGTAVRTVQVDNGSATTDASLTGDISGSGAGGLNKTGAGTLKLSGNNTYTGATTISAGVLRLQTDTALPGGVSDVGGTSNLTFNGGVVGLEPSTELFFRSLGSVGDAAATTFVGAGGWAAYGVDAMVDLGGAGATVSWDAANTGFNGKTLILGASSADKKVFFFNPIDLGSANRTVQVDRGSADTDASIVSPITGTGAGGLTKTGDGTLGLDSDSQNYDALTVNGGTTNVNGALGTMPGLAAVAATGVGTKLRFGTVSQTLNSLSIGAGASVIFTSGAASGSWNGGAGGKTVGLNSFAVIPEPGTSGLLSAGVLGILVRRRRSMRSAGYFPKKLLTALR